MNKLMYRSVMFCKRNATNILTGLGGIGVVATSVMAVKVTPKALTLLEEAEAKKGEKLTKIETVQVAGTVYIPPILIGASTIACIFGANILNKRQQAALMSAYILLDNSFKEYKNKVNELYGEDADQQVRNEIAKDIDEDISVNDDKQLFYDEYSHRYFESTMEDVLRAEYTLNKMLALNFGVYLNEFYELLGIETTDYGDYLGWSSGELMDSYWYCWIDFEHTKVETEDGIECYVLSMNTEPSFGFEDY